MTTMTCQLNSLTDTEEFGRRLGESLFPGAVIAMVGPMGAGKTTLVRSIAMGLGVNNQQVSSPTFALIHEYAGRVPIYHFDTYRLPSIGAFMNLGINEYYQGEGVCIIEWADRVEAALPREYL